MKRILMIAASVLLICSCEKVGDTEQANSSITLSQESFSASPDGESVDVTVTSSEDWRVSGKSDWVTVSAESGKSGEKLTFTVAANTDGQVKETSYKIFAGSAVKEFFLTSEPSTFLKLKSESEVGFLAEGGQMKVTLDCNMPKLEYSYEGDGADWITFVDRKDVFGKVMLIFEIEESEIYFDKSSSITITGEGGKSVKVDVTQERKYAIVSETERIDTDMVEKDASFTIRTNVEYDKLYLPDWITVKSEIKGTVEEDGLTPVDIVLHLDESIASRMFTVNFTSEGKTYHSVIVKQQNPNPIIATIPDAGFRNKLVKLGWIVAEEDAAECEVLAAGMTATSLDMTESYYEARVKSLEGISAFPNLSLLFLKDFPEIRNINLDGCQKMTKVTLDNVSGVTSIDGGTSPLKEIYFQSNEWSGYLMNESISLSGKNVESIYMNYSSRYINYYDSLKKIDVSGCPALVDLKARREFEDDWSGQLYRKLETIYVSADQKAAYEAGALTIDTNDNVTIQTK